MNSATRYNPAGPPTPAPQAAGPHAPKWCPAMVKAGLIPKLTLDAPHFLHVIRSSVRLSRHRSRVCSAASSSESSNAAAVRGGHAGDCAGQYYDHNLPLVDPGKPYFWPSVCVIMQTMSLVQNSTSSTATT